MINLQFEFKYLLVVLSIFLIIGGLYFKFLYDVPDGQDQTNNFVSWFLVVIGIIGIIISVTMKKRINPLVTESDDDSLESDSTNDKSRNRRWKR